jgi:uncharacterized protein (TIGR02145 family)
MKHLVAVLFALLSLNAFSQIPEYVPTDGLVAWYPLDGFLNNGASVGHFDGISFNGNFIANRFDEENAAAGLPGNHLLELPLNPALLSNDFSLSFWVYKRANSVHNPVQIWADGGPGRVNFGFNALATNGAPFINEGNCNGGYGDCGITDETTATPSNEWIHFVYIVKGDDSQIFLNGTELTLQKNCTLHLDCEDESMSLWFGGDVGGGATEYFNGDFDDIGIWHGTLSPEEIWSIYVGEPLDLGCTDAAACNFNPEATEDDGSCVYSGCNDPSACNFNGADICDIDCIYPAIGEDCTAGEGLCGPGTYWEVASQTCVVTNPSDSNFDGCVQLSDLLDLLGAYGTCEWQCGDPMSYHGYDYETVLIGEQCWFAENLRAENYTNGQPITEVQASADWEQVSSGARAVVGDNAGMSVEEYNANLEAFGRIYNGYAVMDPRGLCPSGWHLPSDADWIQMEMHLGLDEGSAYSNGYRGDEGVLLKSSEADSPSWNGNNESGWSGLPGGNRGGIGNFNQVNNYGYWWTSTVEGELDGIPWVFTRSLATDNDAIYRDSTVLTTGNSVRCVQDE